MRHGMKIQLHNLAVIRPQFLTLPYERLLKPAKMHRVKRVGIGGHGRALGNGIEAGKQTDRRAEGLIAHMSEAFGSHQLQRQEGKQVIAIPAMILLPGSPAERMILSNSNWPTKGQTETGLRWRSESSGR